MTDDLCKRCKLCGEIRGFMRFPISGTNVDSMQLGDYCDICLPYDKPMLSMSEVKELINTIKLNMVEL